MEYTFCHFIIIFVKYNKWPKNPNWFKILMPHLISLAESMNLEHSIKVGNHERYPVHLKCLRNIKKIKCPDFQAMTLATGNIGHRGTKGILFDAVNSQYALSLQNELTLDKLKHTEDQTVYFNFFQKTWALQSRDVVTLFHLFTIATYGRNCFDMQHWGNKSSPSSLTHWCSHLTCMPHFCHSTMNNTELQTKSNEQQRVNSKQRAMSNMGVYLVVWIDVSIWREVSKVYFLFPDELSSLPKIPPGGRKDISFICVARRHFKLMINTQYFTDLTNKNFTVRWKGALDNYSGFCIIEH